MLGIIANSWRRLLGYVAEAVTFDGTNDYMNATSITGIADSKQGTVSVWVRPQDITLPIARLLWFGGASPLFGLSQTAGSGIYHIFLKNSAGTLIWSQNMGTAADYTSDTWYHLCISWDLSTLTTHMYLDDVSNKGVQYTAPVNALVDLTTTPYRIGSTNTGAAKFYGDTSELYFTNEYLDISVEANRRKFISNEGKPVDLGSTGQTPTGTSALIYFKGDAAVWNAGTNAGSGGNFTMTGAVTDSVNEPVELPPFAPEAVTFDGTNDYLKRGVLTGISDGKQGTFSCWVYLHASGMGGWRDLFAISSSTTNYRAIISISDSNTMRVIGRTATPTIILNHFGTDTLSAGTWEHVLFSWDLATSTSQMYLSGVENADTPVTLTNADIDYTQSFTQISGRNDAYELIYGDVAEMYFTTEYLDISVASNREKFISTDGKPVFLNYDGSTPTGTQPLIYMRGNAAGWNAGTNAGSGGDFTMTGAVTDSTNEPIELP